MTIQELAAIGYEVVCGAIQKDGQHCGYMGEDGPLWVEGHEPPPAPAKRGRPKKSDAPDAVGAEDDLSDLIN